MNVPGSKKDWVLTAEALARLLASFDVDRECAGEKYERMRLKLIVFFDNRGRQDSDALADEIFNRVARKLEEGATIYAANPDSYFISFAYNILKEKWKGHESPAALDREIGQDFIDEQGNDSKRILEDLEYECQKNCIEALPNESRTLVIRYHNEDQGVKMKEKRSRMAQELGMTANALRIKVNRLRDRLDACVERCVNQPNM